MNKLSADTFYEILSRSDNAAIARLCQSDRKFYEFCQQPQVQNLIKDRKDRIEALRIKEAYDQLYQFIEEAVYKGGLIALEQGLRTISIDNTTDFSDVDVEEGMDGDITNTRKLQGKQQLFEYIDNLLRSGDFQLEISSFDNDNKDEYHRDNDRYLFTTFSNFLKTPGVSVDSREFDNYGDEIKPLTVKVDLAKYLQNY